MDLGHVPANHRTSPVRPGSGASARAGSAQHPPRVTSGPTLLIGLAKCGIAGCGCGMTIRTGKGGRYRYYTCNARTNRGATSCRCPSVRAEQLDELVMTELADRLFAEHELVPLLQQVLDTSSEARLRKQQEVEQCEERLATARSRLANLHDAIENGTVSSRDPDIAGRIKQRRTEIDALNTMARTLRQQIDVGPTRITPAAVARFGTIVRERLLHGDGPTRQNIARAFIRTVTVGPNITITGDPQSLAHGAAAVARSKGVVPSFDREWCPIDHKDGHSNHWVIWAPLSK
ncbi:MAG: hypothetical protein DI636_10825 [Pelagerythrobacter marensis]|nr:MAG: hypothetical protein DI636_10825 [Pelagerythrobacter marensis]